MAIHSSSAKRPATYQPPPHPGSARTTPRRQTFLRHRCRHPWTLASDGRIRPVNRLLSSTIDWLASLPSNVRPLALATKFPRVANRIAQEWREPSACRRDFDDLVYDKRGTRRGFPPDVYVELLALRDYYYGYDLKLANEG